MIKAHDALRMPDEVGIPDGEKLFLKQGNSWRQDDITVRLEAESGELAVFIQAERSCVKEVFICWKNKMDGVTEVLPDCWERGYGDMAWQKPEEAGAMPWYFMAVTSGGCFACGVKVRPKAMCRWECKDRDLYLYLDVRCGGDGVALNGRELAAARILMKRYETEDVFWAVKDFCGTMCEDSIYDNAPVYGANNWYYAYGKSSRKDILEDTAYLASLTEGLKNRPFMVIDDGWQSGHTCDYNGGPWKFGNRDFGDMGSLASEMKRAGVRPGIWFRPLLDTSADIPEGWRLQRDGCVLDISVPEALDHVKEDIRRIAGWGYELVKHDFSSFDLLGRWGFQMNGRMTAEGWRFRDASRTTAEIITGFYAAVLDAAKDMLILGCNCIGHLGAGLMQLNRTGDDTSGVEWERTRKMGINTLAFRMPQHGVFFGADTDCVGITERIPWEKNRQWMELLSASQTPFFVSVRPGLLNQEQTRELKDAYRRAAVNTQAAVPLDWRNSATPKRWRTFEGIREYSW